VKGNTVAGASEGGGTRPAEGWLTNGTLEMAAFCPLMAAQLQGKGAAPGRRPHSTGMHEPSASDRIWMERLLRRAAEVGALGEVPVAAVVLDADGRAVGWGSNRRHAGQDPLGHAEIVALRQAAAGRGDWRFNDCRMLVTLEPCPMCAGALIQARMGTVVYGATDPKRGALGGCLDLAADPSAHHPMRVMAGLCEEQARQQLEEWFRQRRSGRIRPPGRLAPGCGKPGAPSRTD
jgi:tRNA(adenine34) deaminase